MELVVAGAVELVVAGVAGVAAGSLFGDRYARYVECDEGSDVLAIRNNLAPMAAEALDRGFLKIYKFGPVEVIGPQLPLKTSPSTEVVRVHYDMEKTAENHVVIKAEHVVGFLVDNGVNIMSTVELKSMLLRDSSGLVKDMHLTGVDVRDIALTGVPSAVYSVGDEAIVDSMFRKFRDGGAVAKLHFEVQFSAYEDNPVEYERRVRRKMCECASLPQNAVHQVHILGARKGSVELIVIASAGFLIGATLVAAVKLGRKFRVGLGGAEVELGEVWYVNRPDGTYEVHGTYPQKQTSSCTLL